MKQTKVLHHMWCFAMVPFLPGKPDTVNDCSKVSGARFSAGVCTKAVVFGVTIHISGKSMYIEEMVWM